MKYCSPGQYYVNFFADGTASGSNDVPFGFPMVMGGGGGVAETNAQRLIQTGQLTPFGSSVDVPADAHSAGETSASSSIQGLSSQPGSSNHLLPNGVTDTPGKRRIARIPKKHKETSEQNQIFTADTANNISESHTPSLVPNVAKSHATLLEPNADMPSDNEDWTPTLADLLESDSPSSESEYLTDEEMGETSESKKRKKKRRLRPLSSDDLSDDEDLRGKRRKMTKRRASHHGDDGDKNLYLQRLG